MDIVSRVAGVRLFLARTQLVDAWECRVLADDAIPSARRIGRSQLRDYVPRVVDVATEALRGDGYRGELRVKALEFARVHAIQRIEEGFSLPEVLAELAHLRTVLLEELVSARDAEGGVSEVVEDARIVTERAYARTSLSRAES